MATPASRKIFPMPPLSMDVRAWRNWASTFSEYLSQFVVDFDPPALVTGFTIERRTIGFYLRWNPAKKARAYDIYRATDGVFDNATGVTRKVGANNVSHLDVVDQVDLDNSTLYYWIVPLNEAGVTGPRSAMEYIANQGVSGGGVAGLPFNGGPLGDGRHGALEILTTTTATEDVPIYQLTSLNVALGATWTPPAAASANNPLGFIISVTGRCTIAGTISVTGRGAGGGPASTGIGKSSFAGFGWGGAGGGGGGSQTQIGGQAAPVRAYTPYGGSDPGGRAPTVGNTQWGAAAGSPTEGNLRQESSIYCVGGGGGGAIGTVGSAGPAITAALDTGLFPTLWSFFRSTLFGWGSGGGAGATNSTTGGAGGGGGGYIIILCDELDFTGSVVANGANGTATDTGQGGGGGGGGGGFILIGYRRLATGGVLDAAYTGTASVTGGTGGAGAGAGAAGGVGGGGYSNIFDMRI